MELESDLSYFLSLDAAPIVIIVIWHCDGLNAGTLQCGLSTVPFQLTQPSCVTGPVVLAKFSHLSCVTTPMTDDFWCIQKMVKKAFINILTGVEHMQHFFLIIYSRRTLIDQ